MFPKSLYEEWSSQWRFAGPILKALVELSDHGWSAGYIHEVSLWTRDGQHVERLLFAGNNLEKARALFAAYGKRRPRARLTIRQRGKSHRHSPCFPVKWLTLSYCLMSLTFSAPADHGNGV